MSLRIDHVETHVVERLANGYLLHLLLHLEEGGEDGAFRRAIYIIEFIACGRSDGCQLFTSRREIFERMVFDAGGKLITHLRGHERMGDVVLLEIFVQGDKVEANLFGDDMDGGSASQGGIKVHHTGIEAIAGVGSHLVFGLQIVELLIPLAESHQVTMGELTALGDTRGA